MKNTFFMILATLLLFLAACQSSEQQAVSTVEAYLQALVEKDETRLLNLTCADWQMNALLELDAFGNVGTRLRDLSCSFVSGDSQAVVVHCTGSIEASYQNEVQSFDLDKRDFLMVNQGGWLVCGE